MTRNGFKLSAQAVDAAADAVGVLLNGGRLCIYSGSQPAHADARVVGAVLLAELVFARTAFRPASQGVMVANAIAKEASAKASGTATWFRAVSRTGAPVFDGTVGKTGADLNLSELAIRAGAIVEVGRLTYTQPKKRG